VWFAQWGVGGLQQVRPANPSRQPGPQTSRPVRCPCPNLHPLLMPVRRLRSKANGSLTLWKDVVIGSKETARASVYHASGRGISHWRGLDIPFDLSLSCNLVSSYLMLDKLHTSNQYKNATKYDCQFGE